MYSGIPPFDIAANGHLYKPLLLTMATKLPIPELKILASVSILWREVARQSLIEKVHALECINETLIIEQIKTDTNDFLAGSIPLERALELAEIYARYNPYHRSRDLQDRQSNSRAFFALTSILYLKIGHDKCFQILLNINNSFQQMKALLAFCHQTGKNIKVTHKEIKTWIKCLSLHISQFKNPAIVNEFSEILLQGAFTHAMAVYFQQKSRTNNWQKLFKKIISFSKSAQREGGSYNLKVIHRLSFYMHEILKRSDITNKKEKVISFFKDISYQPLSQQLAHSLCNRFYYKAFNSQDIIEDWEIVAELSEAIDIGYSLHACCQTRFENWLSCMPEQIFITLNDRQLTATKFNQILCSLLNMSPNFIEQHLRARSYGHITQESKLAIFQSVITMLLDLDYLHIAVKVISSLQDLTLSQALKAFTEEYSQRIGIQQITYIQDMEIDDSMAQTISFSSDSEEDSYNT